MGNSEELKPSKREKPSLPAKDPSALHAFPNWAMMPAHYGRQFTVPPYLNSDVAYPYIPPPYMWVPAQYVIPPYGISYPVFYAHGGVHGHPGVLMAGTSFNMDAPAESSGDTNGRSVKKLKDFQGLAVSVGNRNSGSDEHETDHILREENHNSSDGSNGFTAEAGQRGMKKSRAGFPEIAKDDKVPKNCRGSESIIETFRPANAPVKTEEDMSNVLELKDLSVLNVKPITTYDPQSQSTTDARLQNECELKQEKRRLSNRLSARRSRQRKQAESGELATRVQKITTENISLKSKIDEFMEITKKLELENATLMEKLEDARQGQVNYGVKTKPVDTVNLLARVNNNDSTGRMNEDGDSYESRNRAAKLHLLFDAVASPTADILAAG